MALRHDTSLHGSLNELAILTIGDDFRARYRGSVTKHQPIGGANAMVPTRPGWYKPVILLGGAPGTGKSTVANRLMSRLDLDHRIGTGFIRAILQAETTREAEPELFSMTFESEDPAARLIWQARRLRTAVAACVDRAQREGTSLVIEGSHLLPSVYHKLPADAFAILAAPTETEHLSRIGGHRHTRRTVESEAVRRILQIDELFCTDAGLTGVPVLPGDAPVEDLVESLVGLAYRRGTASPPLLD
jgi:2-phosphoglycerate kinase